VYQAICVLVLSNSPLSTILIFYFGTVPMVWYFSRAPFLKFTKPGANPRCIGDRLVWVVR